MNSNLSDPALWSRIEFVLGRFAGYRKCGFWWPLGVVLAIIYFVFISRRYSGKVSITRDNQGYY